MITDTDIAYSFEILSYDDAAHRAVVRYVPDNSRLTTREIDVPMPLHKCTKQEITGAINTKVMSYAPTRDWVAELQAIAKQADVDDPETETAWPTASERDAAVQAFMGTQTARQPRIPGGGKR